MNRNIIKEALFDKQKQIIINSTQRKKLDAVKEIEDINNIFILTIAKIKL